MFGVLVIPALVAVLVVSHYQAEHAIRAHLDAELGRTRAHTDRALSGFFGPLIDVTSVLASVAANEPEAVRRPTFNAVLYRAISSFADIESMTVTFEDGTARNFGRLTSDVRFRHPEYPAEANWVARTSFGRSGGGGARFEEVFYVNYPQVLTSMTRQRVPDFLDSAAYVGARGADGLFISDVTVGVASGLPVVGVAVPIISDGAFAGAVTANITVSDLSDFLHHNRISENSESLILSASGQVVAASDLEGIDPKAGSENPSATPDLGPVKRRALAFAALQPKSGRWENANSSSVTLDGTEYSVSDFPIENNLGLKYRALIITPLDDFVGDLRRESRNFTVVVGLLLFFEGLLMVRIAHRMANRIKSLSSAIARIRGMEFDPPASSGRTRPPPVQEVAELDRGISLLQSALRSFSLYVPLGVVRKLVEEGKPIAPGVERREMTILFCDLENFSTLAQQVSAEELLEYTSAYFSAATEAITRHGGTVDKFIGDAVMAFWGAPQQVSDHAVRACRAAVDIVRGVERLNKRWSADGKRLLRVRVGVNSASVLVGNIGSPDRLSYTALGDGVNVASRLEGKNKELGSTICLSDSTYEQAKDEIIARPLKPVSVKGRVGEFMVYELIDIADSGEAVRQTA